MMSCLTTTLCDVHYNLCFEKRAGHVFILPTGLVILLACCQGSKHVFMSFGDTQCLFLDKALLVEIFKGSLFLHLLTIGAKVVH